MGCVQTAKINENIDNGNDDEFGINPQFDLKGNDKKITETNHSKQHKQKSLQINHQNVSTVNDIDHNHKLHKNLINSINNNLTLKNMNVNRENNKIVNNDCKQTQKGVNIITIDHDKEENEEEEDIEENQEDEAQKEIQFSYETGLCSITSNHISPSGYIENDDDVHLGLHSIDGDISTIVDDGDIVDISSIDIDQKTEQQDQENNNNNNNDNDNCSMNDCSMNDCSMDEKFEYMDDYSQQMANIDDEYLSSYSQNGYNNNDDYGWGLPPNTNIDDSDDDDDDDDNMPMPPRPKLGGFDKYDNENNEEMEEMEYSESVSFYNVLKPTLGFKQHAVCDNGWQHIDSTRIPKCERPISDDINIDFIFLNKWRDNSYINKYKYCM